MLFHMLKKDLWKRKGINLILFIFITLATVFLSSSVNNILIVSSAVAYYMDYANVPDVNMIVNSESELGEITDWLATCYQQGEISAYDQEAFLLLSEKMVTIEHRQDASTLDTNGNSLYLGTQSVDYVKVYNEDGEAFTLQEGEIAIPSSLMKRNNLAVGDELTIEVENITKTYRIQNAVKDAAFGNDMVGMSRLIVSQEEFAEFAPVTDKLELFYMMSDDTAAFTQQLSNQGFQTIMNTVDRSMYNLIYSFDMIFAALLIVIGICLILIAMLVLRFTLMFTMEEQYQEIGILKAIGLKNRSIKMLYLMKYFVIVCSGACLGCISSIPVSQLMIDSVAQNMIMAQSDANVMINVLCALLIIVLVVAFCYVCTRKLNRVSAITAIHGGQTGERFHARRGLSLNKRSRMPAILYLGVQDILTHTRRYAVLMMTFCISFLLITIPLNTLCTMDSSEMVRKFMIDPESSVYAINIEEGEDQYDTSKKLQEGVKRLQQVLSEKGYDTQASTGAIYFMNYTGLDNVKSQNVMTIQLLKQLRSYDEYEDGSAPRLENEIAFSKAILKEKGWQIGDDVKVTINGKEQVMIITGSYTDYMQIGKSARLNPVINCDQEYMFDYLPIMLDMDNDLTQLTLVQELTTQFPAYTWYDAKALVDRNIGGIQASLQQMLLPMTAMLCAVIMLITLLMERLFISREKGEIAMMKSMGFRNRSITLWQLVRMGLVVVTSMIISIPLSFLSNQFILKPIFAIMGANMNIVVEPLQAYVVYPGILFVGILIATILATANLKAISIREMNRVE